jgi:cysteine desulfurase
LAAGAHEIDIKRAGVDPDVQKPLYFDNQATTPLDPRVLDVMLPYMTANFGNPHSRSHPFGWSTEEACENARAEIAQLIGA